MKAVLKDVDGEKKEVQTRKRTENGTSSGITTYQPTPPEPADQQPIE